jgi:RNA polymerase sigma-70 factor (ECF subfamily)
MNPLVPPGRELYHPQAFMSEADVSTNFSGGRVYVSQDGDDDLLVARCLHGDKAAFESLVERYQRVLFTVALRMLGDHDEAVDATQNAFVKSYEKLATFDRKRRFFSWIYRILFNECLNVRRDRKSREPLTPDLAAVGSTSDLAEANERRRNVQAAILSLPIESREVIILRHFTELSYEQIGETLGIETKTVKSRLHSARQRLAELLLAWDTRQ